MITVKVLLFSVLKEKIGEGSMTVELASSQTGKELLDQLAADFTPILDYRNVIRLAVNESYVDEMHQLVDGDEIALITPVSGG